MKKFLKTIITIIIVVIIILLLLNIDNTDKIFKIHNKVDTYTYELINPETGIINNEYFGIDKYGNNPSETRKGINNAIVYAKENGINNIKLENGIYIIDNEKIDDYQKGIILQSNINIDLNGSIIKIVANDKTNYGVLSVFNVKNVSIFNGTIIGERNEHTYVGNTTHEWGMGVDIRGSENIDVYNLEIYNTTGDAIYVNDLEDISSKNINISNCNLYECRRQGISIIAGENIKIYNNEIHNINGTIPQSGIDLEKNKEEQIINDIFIYENKFYSQASPNCILIWSNVGNVYIENNEFEGELKVNENNNKNNGLIHIGENKHIGNYPVTFYGEDTDLTKTFLDENLKQAILKLVGKSTLDSIYESDIAKIASDNVAGGKQLNLANKGIKKLDGIEIFAKYNLEWLYLDNNEIEDLTAISNIISLTKLNANNNKIEKIDALSKLTKLETISLINNNISDSSVFSNMNNLKYLYIKNNKINSLGSLMNNSVIKEIYSAENRIETIDILLKKDTLKIIDMRKNNIKHVLEESIHANYLDVSENNISDLTFLMESKATRLNYNKQSIEQNSLIVLGSEYVKIDLPKVFDVYSSEYEIKVFGLMDYKLENGYIIVPAKEFNEGGFIIRVVKDNIEYLSYKMSIDNSIIDGVSRVLSVKNLTDQLIVSGIDTENLKIEKFLDEYNFEDKYTISFLNNGNSLDINNFISTGTTMRVFDSEKELYQDFTVVVYGDVNGDGKITSVDALCVISNKISGDAGLNGAYLQSAKITYDSKNNNTMPSAVDALAIIKHKLKLENITQKQ